MKIFLRGNHQAKIASVICLLYLSLSANKLLYALSADEAQTYSFTGSTLTTAPDNYKLSESSPTTTNQLGNITKSGDANLQKRSMIQMDNGFINLSDDTRVWITPSGAALNVKY